MTQETQKLKSKVALVTGAASGLGKTIAAQLAMEETAVLITDIQDSVSYATAWRDH
jgi:NAD(P)-dependent dehydrogenase (short-subunit alcohol dehydrogenase family)